MSDIRLNTAVSTHFLDKLVRLAKMATLVLQGLLVKVEALEVPAKLVPMDQLETKANLV